MNIEPLYLLLIWFMAGLGYAIGRWIERRKWMAFHRQMNEESERAIAHIRQVIAEAKIKERFNDESS